MTNETKKLDLDKTRILNALSSLVSEARYGNWSNDHIIMNPENYEKCEKEIDDCEKVVRQGLTKLLEGYERLQYLEADLIVKQAEAIKILRVALGNLANAYKGELSSVWAENEILSDLDYVQAKQALEQTRGYE